MVAVIAGNKSDTTDGRFNNQKVLDHCAAKGLTHIEVSAKTGDNV